MLVCTSILHSTSSSQKNAQGMYMYSEQLNSLYLRGFALVVSFIFIGKCHRPLSSPSLSVMSLCSTVVWLFPLPKKALLQATNLNLSAWLCVVYSSHYLFPKAMDNQPEYLQFSKDSVVEGEIPQGKWVVQTMHFALASMLGKAGFIQGASKNSCINPWSLHGIVQPALKTQTCTIGHNNTVYMPGIVQPILKTACLQTPRVLRPTNV